MPSMTLTIAPLLASLFALLSFFIGYGIAVGKDHVDPWLPYISDCGNLVPESSVFGILLSLSAFSLFATVCFVHRNAVRHCDDNDIDMRGWYNFSLLLMLLGWASAIGMLMVAHFQEGSILAAHDTGAFMFFFGIIAYFFGYSILCYAIQPRIVSIHLTNFRVLLSCVTLAILVFHMVCLFGEPFVDKVNGEFPKKPEFPNGIERFKEGDPYYINHILTTSSEWVMAFLMLLMILTLMIDLSRHSGSTDSTDSGSMNSASQMGTDVQKPHISAFTTQVYRDVEPPAQLVTSKFIDDEYMTDSYRRRLPRVQMGFNTASSRQYTYHQDPYPYVRNQSNVY